MRYLLSCLPPGGDGLDALRLLSSATVALEVGAPVALLLACVCPWPRPRRWLVRGALTLLLGPTLTLTLALTLTLTLTLILTLTLTLTLTPTLNPNQAR